MSVWLTIPSALPLPEAFSRLSVWHEMGYKIALWLDPDTRANGPGCDFFIRGEFPGWGPSINRLIREVCTIDPSAEWFVGGGDDTLPDPNKRADEIARECSLHFGAAAFGQRTTVGGTLGVMQPVGDYEQWRASDIRKIAGSPWIGREFAKRVYGGRGPFPEELPQMFADEALQCIAEKLGVFWQRPDLVHKHEHFVRTGAPMPPHSAKWNSREHWNESKATFERMKAAGFPGCEP